MSDYINLDLDSAYNRNKTIIDSLDFETLLLELHCNCRTIDEESVMKQFTEDLESRLEDARWMMQENMQSIIKKAKRNQRIAYNDND